MKFFLSFAIAMLLMPLPNHAEAKQVQYRHDLRQQPLAADVNTASQNRVKRLQQHRQKALSYPMMEEMAAELRRNRSRTKPDERGLWTLFHRGQRQALRGEIIRLQKLYPKWKPPVLLAESALADFPEHDAEGSAASAEDAGNRNMDQALVLYRAGRHADAIALLQDDNSMAAREMRGSILFEQGVMAYQTGDYALAAQRLQLSIENGRDGRDMQLMLAWTDYKLLNSDAAMQRFAVLYQAQVDEESAQGLYLSALASGSQAQLPQWAGSDLHDPLRRLMRKQRSEFLMHQGWILAAHSGGQDDNPALDGIHGPQLDAGIARRSKTGDSGLSRLQLELAPVVETGFAQGGDAFLLRLLYLKLDSGSLPAGAFFGSYSAGGNQLAQTDTVFQGLVPHARWRRETDGDAVQASLGTTPVGAPAGMTLTAELMREQVNEQGSWRVAAYRNSVRDTLLSQVGAVDSYSGQAWGRVVRNGARAEVLRMMGGPWSAAANLRGEFITGVNVADNFRLAGGVGLGYDFGLADFSYITLGPGVEYEQYNRNLSHFTWGHGGYFSPQSFVNAGMALRLLTREGGRWLLRGQVSAGWQAIVEDAAPCFPVAPASTLGNCGDYAGSSRLGPGGSLEGLWRYAISPSWQLGGALGWRYGQSYSDSSVMITLRYNLNERRALYRTDLPEGMFGELY